MTYLIGTSPCPPLSIRPSVSMTLSQPALYAIIDVTQVDNSAFMTWLASTLPPRDDPHITMSMHGSVSQTISGLGRMTRTHPSAGDMVFPTNATGGVGVDPTPTDPDFDGPDGEINTTQKPRHLRLAQSRPVSPRGFSKSFSNRKGGESTVKHTASRGVGFSVTAGERGERGGGGGQGQGQGQPITTDPSPSQPVETSGGNSKNHRKPSSHAPVRRLSIMEMDMAEERERR